MTPPPSVEELTAKLLPSVVAWEALAAHFAGAPAPPARPDLAEAHCPLFVSFHKASRSGGTWRLRGCIGTLEPRPVASAVREYAMYAAMRDRRFPPVEARELPRLRCTVSLLSAFEAAAGWEDWEVGKHGLIIEFLDPHSGTRRTATFLPDVAAHEGWDKQQTLDHLIRKAGYNGPAVLVRGHLRVTRYQASTCCLTYEEYTRLAAEAEPSSPRSPRPRKQQTLVTM